MRCNEMMTRWAIVVCGMLTASNCGPEEGPDWTRDVVVDEFGGTCGEWQTAKGVQRINATCGAGMECIGWYAVYPDNQVGNHYGRCLPMGAICDATDWMNPSSACPDERLTCIMGFSAPPPGACFVHCRVPQDCPGPFQVCISGGCQFQSCRQTSCSRGAHCENDICVAD